MASATVPHLADVCDVRAATDDDAIGGVRPDRVARPDSTAQTAELMRACHAHGLAVTVRGAGTKQTWGRPPTRLDVVLETGAMDSLVEHADGDLIATAGAGMRLADLNAVLAEKSQQLLVDDLVGGSTLGGVVATNLSGPRRLLPGAPRDLLIGVTMVRADGTVAKAGGKVVKNVAGYDLGKLLCGSFGTLGVITEATFRLHPVPPASRWVETRVAPDRLAGVLAAVVHSQLVPAAVEVRAGAEEGVDVAVLLSGTEGGVAARAERLAGLLPHARPCEEPDWATRLPWQGQGGAPVAALKLTCRLSGVADLVTEAARGGVAVSGSAGAGVLYGAAQAADAAATAAVVDRLRQRCTEMGGSLVVLDAPGDVKQHLDVWGPVGGVSLMRRIKDEFDPSGVLSPGRFVGGI